MLLRRNVALAKARSCFSPALSDPWFICISRTLGSSVEGLWLRSGVRWHLSRTCRHSSVVHCPRGSRLLLIVPEKRETSWLTMVYSTKVSKYIAQVRICKPTTRVRRSSRPIVAMSMPSMLIKRIRYHFHKGNVTYMILPLVRSIIRSKDIARVDFPVIYSAPMDGEHFFSPLTGSRASYLTSW